MTALPKDAMREATRLTREGRLTEAVAVLRGALSGNKPPAPDIAAAAKPAPPSPSRRLRFTMPPIEGIAAVKMPTLEGILPRRERSSPIPNGAQFEEYAYANEAGSRTYKLYVPRGYNKHPLPLVVMLHGCTQSPDDFAAGTRMNQLAEEQLFLVAYPAQSQTANISKCWNWFNATDQQRDRGEPSLIAGITRQIMRDVAVDPRRVYISGLSAGGAAAAIMGTTYPDLYAGAGVHSGLACGAAADLPSAMAAMRSGAAPTKSAGRHNPSRKPIPTIVFHGDGDTTVSPINGDQVIAQARTTTDLHTETMKGVAAGGIRYTRTIQTDRSGRRILEEWLLHGAGHAWSGGSPAGSFTEPRGPDASREMLRFFEQQQLDP